MTVRKSKKTEIAKAVSDVKNLNANDIVNEIGNLQVTILSTLSGVSAQIAQKLELLDNTEVAISDMQNRLNELYAIEKEAQVLEEIKTRLVLNQEKHDKDLLLHDQEWNEKESQRAKDWAREVEEHTYEITQRKKRFEDDFNAEVATKQRLEKIRADEVAKSLNAREVALMAQEDEVKNLKDKVAGIDARIKSESDRVAAIVRAEMRNSYEHQIQLLNKDSEAQKNMFDAREKSLQIQVGQLVEQVAELNKQLGVARQDAKEVTSAALSSASGRQVVDALQRVVDSKDTNTKK